MIRWRLNQMMAERRLSGKQLAEKLQYHSNTVYRLRRTDKMPLIDGARLNELCTALECTPADLIDFVPDNKVKKQPPMNEL